MREEAINRKPKNNEEARHFLEVSGGSLILTILPGGGKEARRQCGIQILRRALRN